MLPFWTLLSACEIRDKIHIIYKELTRDWVKSKVAKSEFYPSKSQNAGELCGKLAISSIKFPVSFFSVGLDKAVRIRDKIQVVYKEMADEGAKFNVAKCNLIGSIQFRFSQI